MAFYYTEGGEILRLEETDINPVFLKIYILTNKRIKHC